MIILVLLQKPHPLRIIFKVHSLTVDMSHENLCLPNR